MTVDRVVVEVLKHFPCCLSDPGCEAFFKITMHVMIIQVVVDTTVVEEEQDMVCNPLIT